LISPAKGAWRSTLVFFSHVRPERNAEVHETLQKRGIDIALRAGRLRLSPHLYNTAAQIDRVLDELSSI
jgi:selenocysteine lyase/cysteine desulfurase